MDAVNLKYIFDTLFKDRNKFQYLTDKDKEKNGFIVNRYLSKKFPDYAQKLNVRSGDMSMVLNLWWIYLGTRKDPNYRSWIWVNGKKGVSSTKVDLKTIRLIQNRYQDITVEDIEYLNQWFPDIFKEDVKYYKKLEEDYG
jgi:hypothetical protein